MQTANLIKDIRVERFHKIDMGLKALEGPITVKLNNVSAMECNIIRHFFQGALNQFYRLAQVSLQLMCLRMHTPFEVFRLVDIDSLLLPCCTCGSTPTSVMNIP